MSKQVAPQNRKKSKATSPRATHSVEGSFESVMQEVTRDMPRHRRLFSNLLHRDAVSSVSDLVSSILARPNAILFGAIFSFVATFLTYLLSKNLGYSMSGFESIGSFILGWSAGNVFDLYKHFFGKR